MTIPALTPIGVIRSTLRSLEDAPRQGDEGAPDAWLEVDPAVAPALTGLRAGDAIVLITWLDRADRGVLETHPRNDPSLPRIGVFATRSPDRPFVAILGGAKVSDKLEVIENLLDRVDALLIGGAMAYTFFKAQGLPVGKSLVEADLVDTAGKLLERAKSRGIQLVLPVDHVVAAKIDASAPTATLAVDDQAIGDRMGLDIGPKTVAAYADVIGRAKTVVWNGPMGVFEMAPFAAGTIGVAKAVANVAGTTIIGGGDSVAAVSQAGVADRMTHISTGGGASLEFLGGRTLPGVAALGGQTGRN